MSANFWCWVPALMLSPHSHDFLQRVDELNSSRQPPEPAIVEFVSGLLHHYPDLSPDETETAWADGPMLNDASGGFINFSIRWDYYEKVVPLIVSTGHRAGLNCYDPQISKFYPLKP